MAALAPAPKEETPGYRFLTAICKLAYGEQELPYPHSEKFHKALDNCRRSLVGTKAPTAPTIAGWFEPNTSVPERAGSFQFLIHFLDWAVSVKLLKSEAIEDLSRELEQVVRELGPKPGPKRPIKGEGSLAIEKLRPIAGAYQIIRPYTTDAERYVLEVMAINIEAAAFNEVLSMYSHTRPDRRYRYRGNLTVNNKYCFGFCAREHEDFDFLETPRCVVMYLSQVEPSLSGIMLRGVSALNGPKIAIGVPFIAIKTENEMSILETADLEKVRPNLFKISDDLLVGDISKSEKLFQRQFTFCDGIFKALKKQLHNDNGYTLQTANHDQLRDALRTVAGADATYLSAWKTAQVKSPKVE